MKKMKVAQEGPMYTHNDFGTFVCVNVHTAAINIKGDSVLRNFPEYTIGPIHESSVNIWRVKNKMQRKLKNII